VKNKLISYLLKCLVIFILTFTPYVLFTDIRRGIFVGLACVYVGSILLFSESLLNAIKNKSVFLIHIYSVVYVVAYSITVNLLPMNQKLTFIANLSLLVIPFWLCVFLLADFFNRFFKNFK